MKLSTNPDSIKQTKWYEYAIRFGFGGLVTVMTGIIAHKYGPVVGGLFLAFPSIFPASVSLVEKHKKQKQEQDGHDGDGRAKKLAAVDAAGASLGAIGLIAFAGVVWFCSTSLPAWAMLLFATLAWAAVSLIAWVIRQRV
ncbi:MAG TPA: DUF3147 family protein [Capsulimonadaceae bacterium]|nr:DUF3147 family protein [Capsulimonadaceae bacterium]